MPDLDKRDFGIFLLFNGFGFYIYESMNDILPRKFDTFQ